MGGHSVSSASQLAVTSTEGVDHSGPYLKIFLYHSNPTKASITRILGEARGHDIKWLPGRQVGFLKMDKSSSLAVINEGKRNYVYYIPEGSDAYEVFVDMVDED